MNQMEWTMTDEMRESIREIGGKGRDIVTVAGADRMLKPFGFTAKELNLVYTAEAGIDWGSRAERWESGEMVNVCTLAWVLADKLGAPDIKYDTDYIGEGKRSAAVAAKAMLRLRKMSGENIPECIDCGSVELAREGNRYGETIAALDLCFGCARSRFDRTCYTNINVTINKAGSKFNQEVLKEDKHRFELLQGSHRLHGGDFGFKELLPHQTENTPMEHRWTRFDFTDLDEALDCAYSRNRESNLVGPVNVTYTVWGA